MQRLFVRLYLPCIVVLCTLIAAGCMTHKDEALALPATPTARANASALAEMPTSKQAPGHMMLTVPDGLHQIPAATLYQLSTAEQLATVIAPTRDLRQLALRFVLGVETIPTVVNAMSPTFAVGDRQSFWVHDLDSNRNFEISAELVAETDMAYVWVEEDRAYDGDAILRSVTRFSSQSYPAAVAGFGNEWTPGVDNDPRLHILHAFGLGNGIAGYYSSTDQYSRLARPFSNEKEMFYINLQWLNQTQNYEYYETVLAHEFQHMIHWHQDRNEETWVNEGLSEYAQEIAGYEPDTIFAQTFATQPHTQLNTWGENPGNNSVHYGSAYLFVAYIAQRFGLDAIQALVAHPANGLQGVQGMLDTIDRPDLRVDNLFADWVVANYVDAPDALGMNGVYGYENIALNQPVLAQTYSSYPATPYQSSLPNYAAHYHLFTGDERTPQEPVNVTLDFRGQTSTRLASLAAYSGRRAWWSNRGDDLHARLSRSVDLRSLEVGTPVTMTVAMWWDIEHAYDYGYLSASRDGEKWSPLAGRFTTLEDPNGYTFGPGYTGQSTLPGASAGESAETGGETPGWVIEEVDLSAYAGDTIWLSFDYVTDDAVNTRGWFIDDIQIPALGYREDWEGDRPVQIQPGETDAWRTEGWLLTDNQLPQGWLLQLIYLHEGRLQKVERYPVDASGRVRIPLVGLTSDSTVVLAVSPLAPVTTEPASYTLEVK